MTGAIVLGADYRGLGIVQSLGRRGIPVWVVYDRYRGVANFSRYTTCLVREPARSEGSRLEFLHALVREHHLHGWVLFPTGDESTTFCARHRDVLAQELAPTTPSWHVLQWAHDKRLTRELAAKADVPTPRVWDSPDDVADSDGAFPVIVKPAVRTAVNPLTRDKAWRADDIAELRRLYDAARRLMNADEVMIQELVPGGGGRQLSYAAFVVDGKPIATLTARRTRQYPMDFGRASTFVESIENERVADHGARLVGAMSYTGIVEIEFKEHAATGELMLLDINPRVWGWHTLGWRAGVDFTWLAWKHAVGRRTRAAHAHAGVRWIWPAADLPVAMREVLSGRLSAGDYLRGLRKPRDLATLTQDDPLPGLIEVPLQLAGRVRGVTHVGEVTRLDPLERAAAT